MKKCATDPRFLLGFVLAHLLMYISFHERAVFWYLFTATMLVLISYAILNEEIEDNASVRAYIFYGVLSGFMLFGVFFSGNFLIGVLNLPMSTQISKLYSRFSPSMLWHYAVLIPIIVPGEEIFWRGFIQKRLLKYTNTWTSILVSSLLYASVHVNSGHFILPLAAFAAGLFWSSLYAWKRSLPLVIVSHLTFDLLLFVFLPFR